MEKKEEEKWMMPDDFKVVETNKPEEMLNKYLAEKVVKKWGKIYKFAMLLIFNIPSMATITLRLSAKTNKENSQHEILMRFRHGKIDQYTKLIFLNTIYLNQKMRMKLIHCMKV